MKRLTVILISIVLLTAFLAGCGAKDRELFAKVDLGNYIEIGTYNGIEVDTKSDDYLKYYDSFVSMDISDNELYKEQKEGAVADGDIANIDYVGKIDGVKFDGGSAEGYDLTIGSGTFIDDFEEELIGVKVGETKDVTAKFPDKYSNNPDLAGKEAVFTVTVNSIKVAMTPEEAYEKMKFDSPEAYVENLTKRSVDAYVLDTVCDSVKIKDYPKDDKQILKDAISEFYSNVYGENLEMFVAYSGASSADQLFEEITVQEMTTSMAMYYILDAENLEILESTVNSQNTDNAVLAEYFAVQDTVTDFLYKNAVIK